MKISESNYIKVYKEKGEIVAEIIQTIGNSFPAGNNLYSITGRKKIKIENNSENSQLVEKTNNLYFKISENKVNLYDFCVRKEPQRRYERENKGLVEIKVDEKTLQDLVNNSY